MAATAGGELAVIPDGHPHAFALGELAELIASFDRLPNWQYARPRASALRASYAALIALAPLRAPETGEGGR